MAKYKIVFKKSVAKDLRNIPKKDLVRILARIDALTEEPRGADCVKLSGLDRYRVRQGQYRILYEILDNELIVTVVKVSHRTNAYKVN